MIHGSVASVCGRFNLRTDAASLVQMFLPALDASDVPPLEPRYNIAPTQSVAAITGGDRQDRSLRFFRWGLVPPWADSLTIGNRMINARSETVAEKRSFQKPFAARRCLIPASGYYEWLKLEDGGKQPIHIHRPDDGLLAMAGLWEENRKADPEGKPVFTCTILTTPANKQTAEIHDRMPVFVKPNDLDAWLDDDSPTDRLLELCRPLEGVELECTPVSTKVNRPGYDGPECLDEVRLSTQPDLFE